LPTILGETPPTASTAATLDDLFRRAGVRHPDALALADPPNRQNFTNGIPRALSFAQADRAIFAIAARLRGAHRIASKLASARKRDARLQGQLARLAVEAIANAERPLAARLNHHIQITRARISDLAARIAGLHVADFNIGEASCHLLPPSNALVVDVVTSANAGHAFAVNVVNSVRGNAGVTKFAECHCTTMSQNHLRHNDFLRFSGDSCRSLVWTCLARFVDQTLTAFF